MADGDVIRSFLVGLGFKIDDAGMRNFNNSIVSAGKVAKEFSVVVGSMAVAVEEAVRRISRQFENLYYQSQQTGVSVKNLQAVRFGFTQIGLSAQDAVGSLATFATALRDNPGLRGFANAIVPGFRNAQEAIEGLAGRYKGIIDQFGENSGQAAAFRRMLQVFGLSAEQIRQMVLNMAAYREGVRQSLDIQRRFGLNADQAAEQGVKATRAWGTVWEYLKTGLDVFIVQTFPTVERLLKDFAEWIRTEGSTKIEAWAKAFGSWLQDEATIENIEKIFKEIGKTVLEIAKGVETVVKWISEIDKALSGLERNQGLMALKEIVTWHGWGGIFGLGRGGFTPDPNKPNPFQPGYKAPPPLTLLPPGPNISGALGWLREHTWIGRNFFGQGGAGGQDTFEGPGQAPIPGGRKASFGGGGSGIDEILLTGFYSWWRGDAQFRPFVSLAAEVYDRLTEILRNVFGLNAGGAAQTGHGSMGGAGEGGAATSNVPGRGRGMRAGSGGGSTGGVSLAQMKQLALDAGFTAEEAPIIAATLMHESSGNPRARGAAGELGISQIHPGAWGQDLANQAYGNPKRAMEIARMVYLKQGWNAWSSYKSGAYRQYLGEAQSVRPEPYTLGGGRDIGGGDGGLASRMANFVRRTGVFGTPEEASQNLVDIRSSTGETWKVHRMAAPAFQGLIDALEKVGYHPKSSGGYANRSIRGGGGASAHAYGAAIDIDAENNPLGSHRTNLPSNIEEMAAKLGIIWGGKWRNRPDPMHFEWAGGRPLGLDGAGGRQTSVDSDHTTNITINGGATDATVKAHKEIAERQSALHIRNLRNSIA